MISWTFAAAAAALALLPPGLPLRLRIVLVAGLSIAGVALVWSAPIGWIAAATLAVWLAGAALPRLPERTRSAALAVLIAGLAGGLAWLRAGHSPRVSLVPTTEVIGLSYFALKFVQHLVDAAAGRATAGLPAFAATIFFLPTFTAGPIERTGDFSGKLARPPLPWSERVLGFERILIGLGKKMLLGDPLLAYAEPVFAAPAAATHGALWLAADAFAIALYLDFAGYSDIAIGAGQLAGLRIRENFDNPFLQPNIGLLWQRWHMSLTTWLRDFVFVPVARRSLRRTRRPLLSQAIAQTATMVACGLWHGVAWNFAAWGLYHAFFLTGYSMWRARRTGGPAAGAAATAAGAASTGARVRAALVRLIATLVTFHVFSIGLVIFGSSLRGAAHYIARMFLVDGLLHLP